MTTVERVTADHIKLDAELAEQQVREQNTAVYLRAIHGPLVFKHKAAAA